MHFFSGTRSGLSFGPLNIEPFHKISIKDNCCYRTPHHCQSTGRWVSVQLGWEVCVFIPKTVDQVIDPFTPKCLFVGLSQVCCFTFPFNKSYYFSSLAPLCGKLSDLIGRKPILYSSIAAFLVRNFGICCAKLS